MIAKINNLLTLSDTPRYNIKAVVQQTCVNVSTLRAWEQRYGMPRPQRSGQGHRLYSQRDIAIITWLRQCTHNGLAIRQAIAMLSDDDLEAGSRGMWNDAPTLANDRWLSMRGQLLNALVDVNLRQAHLLVNTICTFVPIETVVLELFCPVLMALGVRSAHHDLSSAAEHFATHFLRQRLLALLQLYGPFATGRRLICMGAPGDQHEIDLLMFVLLMEQRGWEVIYLGQNVALDGFAPFLARQAPALISFSVAHVEHVRLLSELSSMVKPLQEQGLLLSYGGRVFTTYPELHEGLAGVFLGPDLYEAIKRADALGEQLEQQWYDSHIAANDHEHQRSRIAVGV